MNKIILSIFLFFICNSSFSQPNAPSTAKPVDAPPAVNKNQAEIQFVEENFDFGTIKEGDLAIKEFKFKNIGKEPLILTNVSSPCGCLTPEWPKEPIKPGEKGVVRGVYNSQGRSGAFEKSITVQSNAKTARKVLTVKGTVEAKKVQSPAIIPPPVRH